MADSSRARLTAVPAVTPAESLPVDLAPTPEDAPNLLAALDAGDEEAVRRWVLAHTPEPQSLLLYGVLVGVGIAGLMEWPAVLVAALGQVIIDRRFGGVEKVTAELRARLAAVSARA